MFWTDSHDAQVARIDPLGADALMQTLPDLNASADVAGMIRILEMLCKNARLHTSTFCEVAAAVRDLGFVCGSIRRHGHDPLQHVPQAEQILVLAGKLTDLPARDTLMHYTIWNPQGPRLRVYTNHPQEPHLIQSICISFPAIRAATRELFQLGDMDLSDPRAARVGSVVARRLKEFLSGLSFAEHHVTADVFISMFRPYFEPIVVGGTSLRGPGAVTMPLHIFDFLLWGSSELNERYHAFTSDYIPYNMSEFRTYYLRARNQPSLVDRLEKSLSSDKPVSRSLLRAIKAWFRRICGFRRAHLHYAIRAYRGDTPHSFSTGSGGHTADDLALIAELTDKHSERVNKMFSLGG